MPQSPIADHRSWIALLVCTAIAAWLIHRWHFLAWVIGAVVLVLVFRGVSIVLAARASMHDPEDDLEDAAKKG